MQAKYAADREQLLEELDALEKMRRKIRMLCASGREVPEDQQRKVFAAIEVKTHALAELDGESAKLANLTEQTMKEPIRVRGRAYEGSSITINGISYLLPSEVRRVVFKLRNKQVVMVGL